MLRFLLRFHYLLRRRRFDADLREEMEFHRAQKQARMEASGLSRRDAEHASRRALGNLTLAREEARGVWIWPSLESVGQDLRYAARSLWGSPGFATLAIATLGTAIGLNTSLFTAFHALFLRPWPVIDPARVVQIMWMTDGRRPIPDAFVVGEYLHLRDSTRSVGGLVAMGCVDGREPACRVTIDGDPVGTLLVSRNYFRVLGIGLARGPGLDGSEPDPDRMAVISDGLWQRRFGGDPAIVGKTIRLNQVDFTIVGVTARGFGGTTFVRKDVMVPLSALALLRPHADALRVRIAGRLSPGASRDEVRIELDRLIRDYRGEPSPPSGKIRTSTSGQVALVPTSYDPNPGKSGSGYFIFGLLAAGTLLALVLACANVGNLLLARAATRGRELAVRLSLGASRLRLIRQLLTESLVLASAAGTIGVGIAYVLPRLFLDRVYFLFAGLDGLPFSLSPDLGVLLGTGGLVLLTCLTFGLAPTLHAVRRSIAGVFRSDRAGAGARLPLRTILLAIQVVVSVVLLVCAGLLTRAARAAAGSDLGFDAKAVYVVEFDLPPSYDQARRAAFSRALLNSLPSSADVPLLALTGTVPFGGAPGQCRITVPGQDTGPPRIVDAPNVSGSYFDVLRIRILAGRSFKPEDEGQDVIVLSQRLADELWPGEAAVGRTLIVDNVASRVVGVAADADTTGRTFRGRRVGIMLYRPLDARTVSAGGHISVLTRGAAADTVTAALARVDTQVQFRRTHLQDDIDRELMPMRLGATAAGVLGILALTLASVGVSGVFAYIVEQRTREIGVRMALGARPAEVIRCVLATGSRGLLIGLALGYAAATMASQVLRSALLGISPLDPMTYLSVAVVLVTAAVLAIYVPARRATRIDPVVALRHE
jgi:predicted permease